ncbi:MAG: PorT family protein [Bacteroidales bacterium]|jgi:hypothetical protein|nr:PorT family protein [Bacteroidales bacterium]
MKKIAIFCCFACLSANTIAQKTVRIGNMEIVLRKAGNDTITQIIVDEPQASSSSRKKTKYVKDCNPNYSHGGYLGFGFVYPARGNDIYDMRRSFTFDIGGRNTFRIARLLSIGTSLGYSFYNYHLKDAVGSPGFEEITGDLLPEEVKKEAFHSNNLTTSFYTRFYFYPPQNNHRKLYIDAGIQGDWAFAKHYKVKDKDGGKDKFYNSYAFNPFYLSAIARIGWNGIAIFGRYRFTDAFNKKVFNNKDLPPYSLGIQFN